MDVDEVNEVEVTMVSVEYRTIRDTFFQKTAHSFYYIDANTNEFINRDLASKTDGGKGI